MGIREVAMRGEARHSSRLSTVRPPQAVIMAALRRTPAEVADTPGVEVVMAVVVDIAKHLP